MGRLKIFIDSGISLCFLNSNTYSLFVTAQWRFNWGHQSQPRTNEGVPLSLHHIPDTCTDHWEMLWWRDVQSVTPAMRIPSAPLSWVKINICYSAQRTPSGWTSALQISMLCYVMLWTHQPSPHKCMQLHTVPVCSWVSENVAGPVAHQRWSCSSNCSSVCHDVLSSAQVQTVSISASTGSLQFFP